MKKIFLLLLIFCPLLPIFSVAQTPPVQVPNSCYEGNAFTIRVPVRIPAGVSGKYEWYRNDTLIAGTRTTLTAGVAIVAYTIPASEAYGDSVVFYFKYSAYEDGCDDCEEWVASKKYAVTFLPTPEPDCSLDGTEWIVGDEVVPDCQMSSAGSIVGDEVVPDCQMSSAGSIVGDETADPDCQMSSAGSIVGDETADPDCQMSSAGSIVGDVVSLIS